MRGPVGLAISRPVTALVGVFLVWLFGTLSITELPVQLTPDLTIPTLTVTTRWPGAAPVEVERDVVELQEEELKNVDGLERMTSESKQGEGTVTLEFAVGTDLDEAVVRVSNRLTQVSGLPDNVDEPVLTTADSAGPPLAVLVLRKRDRTSMAPYRTWGKDQVVPEIERIPGIAAVRYFGGRDSEVHVRFDAEALAARGLTVADLTAAMRGELRDISAGDLDVGKRQVIVRTRLTPPDPSGFDRVVLGVGDDGQPVRMGDVARVEVALGKQRSFVLSDGQETIALLLDREAGANVLSVTEEVRRRVASLQAERLDAMGIELAIVSDQTGYIYAALQLVRNNLLLGAVLASIVLWVFLGGWRSAGLVALAIPTCVLGTVLGMRLLGRSVNVVSLAGMAFAVGMVVDNAIVVIESIVAEREAGKSPVQAAYDGAQKVYGAIVASTLTTIAVFVPVLAWQGEVGQLLTDLAVAIVLAVSLSLAVSTLVIPSFAARLPVRDKRPADEALRWGRRARQGVVRGVRSAIRTPARAALVVGGSVAAALLLVQLLMPPMEYLPTGNRPLVFGVIVPPPGYSVDEMRHIGDGIQDRILPHLSAEVDGVPPIERSFYVGSPGSGFMGATSEDPERVGELVGWLRGVMGGVPGVFGFAFQSSLFGRSIGSSRSVDVEVSGPDLDAVRATAGRLFPLVSAAVPGAQVRPVPSLDAGGPELRVRPRREAAQAVGLSGLAIGEAVDAFVDGRRIGEYGNEGERKLDVLVVADPPTTDPDVLRTRPIATPMGQVVPLASVVTIDETITPINVRHIERRRAITLQVTPPDDVEIETAIAWVRTKAVEPALRDGSIPAGVRVDLAGAADDLAEAQQRMLAVLALAMLISFLLMSALFEDFVAPIAILVAVPLAAAGGLMGLLAMDTFLSAQALDMMTAMGFVILIGVVVNNPILVVDGALARIRAGEDVVDAIVGGVDDRVRPITMTTLTTLAGLLPLVLVPGQGSELYRGVGAVVLGGLALATALTLVVVPALYRLLALVRRPT